MKLYKVAILGATGAVGQEMMKILAERKFPVGELHLLASEHSVGKEMEFGGKKIAVELACDEAFAGMDIVLGAASADLARQFAPAIRAAGAVFVDNSSAFRMQDDVPLVVPEINPEDVKAHHGIISNPNCSTIITLMAVKAIQHLSPIKTMVASTYQAVSGAGAGGPIELAAQVKALSEGGAVECKTFPYQIAENLLPQIGSFLPDDYTTEEMKMQNEGRKIFHNDMKVTCTCVRVPVMRSHSISVTLRTEKPVSPEAAASAIAAFPGCALDNDVGNDIYPTPLETSGGDIVRVGRIRRDLTDENGLCLWCCGDQVRKGAAQNAVQIAELII